MSSCQICTTICKKKKINNEFVDTGNHTGSVGYTWRTFGMHDCYIIQLFMKISVHVVVYIVRVYVWQTSKLDLIGQGHGSVLACCIRITADFCGMICFRKGWYQTMEAVGSFIVIH